MPNCVLLHAFGTAVCLLAASARPAAPGGSLHTLTGEGAV